MTHRINAVEGGYMNKIGILSLMISTASFASNGINQTKWSSGSSGTLLSVNVSQEQVATIVFAGASAQNFIDNAEAAGMIRGPRGAAMGQVSGNLICIPALGSSEASCEFVYRPKPAN